MRVSTLIRTYLVHTIYVRIGRVEGLKMYGNLILRGDQKRVEFCYDLCCLGTIFGQLRPEGLCGPWALLGWGRGGRRGDYFKQWVGLGGPKSDVFYEVFDPPEKLRIWGGPWGGYLRHWVGLGEPKSVVFYEVFKLP